MKTSLVVTLCVVCCMAPLAQAADDQDEIEKLIVEAYVQGVYVNRDEDAVRRGFHPDFVLHVYDDGNIFQESLQQWLERLQLDGVRSTHSTDYEIEFVDITGNSAVAKLEVFQDTRHLYTDYFGFYRFENGWRFVNKIFFGHQ